MVNADVSSSRHAVAAVGAAVAGSEIARILAQRGVLVIVIEQNPRPYGKIEDGLPRWHVKQRRDEYARINSRLDHPNIEFVPMTRLGRDFEFEDIREGWGLNAIILSHGAWRDRPFPVEGADQFIDRGLVYQNRLVYWFNHYPEAGYSGPRYELPPGALVVGGGLASIDVVKIVQIETTLKALAARGMKENMLRLEREGIDAVLTSHGLQWPDLGIAPCRLFYRRRALDMPLSDIPPGTPAKRAEAIRQARAKILDKARRKYLFDFHELRVPSGLIVENSRLAGLMMSRTEVSGGRVTAVPGSEEPVRSPLTISSVGSIPEAIAGIPQHGEVYDFVNREIGLLMDNRTAVYAAGNVLTGKGNIRDSLDSGTQVGTFVAERYLGLTDEEFTLGQTEREHADEEAEKIAESIEARPALSDSTLATLMRRVRDRQRAVGYGGNYREWIARVTPADLE
jgi:hypothetical protein